MINKINKYIRTIGAVFTLALFFVYYINATMFGHSHIINGTTIQHSHIHGVNHTSTPTGGHTQKEITLISIITLNHSLAKESLRVSPVEKVLEYTILVAATIALVEVDITRRKSPRAPPTVLL